MQAQPTTSFSPSLHVVLCQRCGAPLQAAVTGGMMPCRFCGAQNRVAARNMTFVAQARATAPLPEHERLARLRAQDGQPMLPPAGLQSLFQGGTIPPWKLQEAMAVWQSTRQQLESVQDYEAAERLMFVTMGLSNIFSEQGDLMRQRGMFESVLDVVTLPRHRQVMMSYLARASAKLGDLAGAEEWLRLCDPQSDDLESDSEWRAARALIDTLSGNYQRVVQVLGSANDSVPIQDALDDYCAVLRANAWEKMGQMQAAVGLLLERMHAGHAATITRIVQVNAKWGICAASYPVAESSFGSAAASGLGQATGGALAMVFIPMGVLFVLMALGCLVGMVIAIANEAWDWLIGPGICLAVMGPLGLVFFFGGIKALRHSKRMAHLRLHGVRADAQVRAITPTGMSVNEVPQIEVELMVLAPGQAPYVTRMKLLAANPGQFAPGARIAVKVDPEDPSTVVPAD
ncbi:MAG TPA: hypothetical protein PLI95_24590 [Polyangiaceae bacterium]|nr:hypothetical protein [Polyangiaceae bacterium]